MRVVDHMFDEQMIDSLAMKIILPKGAKNIQLDSPYEISHAPDELHYAYLANILVCSGAYFLASGLTVVCRPSEPPSQVSWILIIPRVGDLRSLKRVNGLIYGPHRTKTKQRGKLKINQILRLILPFFFFFLWL